MVARESATECHQRRAWKRSNGTIAPPLRIIATVEQASAFMWNIGSGVSEVSAPSCRVAMPPCDTYQLPTPRKYALERTQHFGRPVVPDVNRNAQASSPAGAPASGARAHCGGGSPGAMTATVGEAAWISRRYSGKAIAHDGSTTLN